MSRAAALAAIAVAALAGTWARRDYRAWLALGEGGLPLNPKGWLITSYLRLRKADPSRPRCTTRRSGRPAPPPTSAHSHLSAADAARILDAGWGERHPLAGVRPELPSTYVYVYPPRDEAELAVVAQLLDAAIDHMTSKRD